eukprot:553657-Pelagomonas_calceolata.AAC.1
MPIHAHVHALFAGQLIQPVCVHFLRRPDRAHGQRQRRRLHGAYAGAVHQGRLRRQHAQRGPVCGQPLLAA